MQRIGELVFCVDTSAWLDGWVRHYPADVFPSLWSQIEEMIHRSRIRSSEEVYFEIKRKDDSIHHWMQERKKELLLPTDEAVQALTFELLATYPRLVDDSRGRSTADPFVIATAKNIGAVVVTGEIATNNLSKPRIPDVCQQVGIRCITFLDMIRQLGVRF